MPDNKAKAKGKKIGRAARRPRKMRYEMQNRKFTNKLRRIAKHLKTHPGDKVSENALKRLRNVQA